MILLLLLRVVFVALLLAAVAGLIAASLAREPR